MKKIFAWALSFFLATAIAHAQQSLEIIALQHRPVEEVLPVLRPLLEAGGSLSGMNGQLFLRASPGNRAEIRRALAALDVPARRLLIRVATRMTDEMRQQGGEFSGSLGNSQARVIVGNGANSGQGNRAEVRVYDASSARANDVIETVQTVDGGRAFIQAGVSVPVPVQQTVYGPRGAVTTQSTDYRDISRGFYAEPHVTGERVTISIYQQADTPNPHGAQIQHLSTQVSGRLGEWISLGGAEQSASRTRDGAFSHSTREAEENRGVWLKVEEVRGN
ncbi:MAG: hypothetical protein LBS89_00610 [Zoogloeaceae bacterium]|jgi:type II secretory pathway component GspD/PulD (secretin)|nr:hypothetical protein [Zoogloeaceae bacterium]